MKVITIGRSEENQIVLEDDQDMISRQHATLRIYETGKMEIVSTGTNGTFVNGFRIKPNVPYKVTRKDVVSFAHVRQLDWSLVPDPFRYIRVGIIGVLVVALIAVAVVCLWPEKKETPKEPVKQETIEITPIDNQLEEKGNAESPKEDSKETPKEETPKEEAPSQKKEEMKFPPLKGSKKKEKKTEEKPQQQESEQEEIVPPVL